MIQGVGTGGGGGQGGPLPPNLNRGGGQTYFFGQKVRRYRIFSMESNICSVIKEWA